MFVRLPIYLSVTDINAHLSFAIAVARHCSLTCILARGRAGAYRLDHRGDTLVMWYSCISQGWWFNCELYHSAWHV